MSRTNQSLAAEAKLIAKINDKGGKLLTPYMSAKAKVTIMCANGHIFHCTPHHVNSDDQWCSQCPNKKTLEIMQELFNRTTQQEGLILEGYTKATEQILLQCHHGHRWYTTALSVCKTPNWCTVCDDLTGVSYENKVIRTIQYRNGRLNNEYANKRGYKLNITCEYDHMFEMLPSNIICGNWCNICTGTSPVAYRTRLITIITNKGGILLSEYVNSRTPITLQCSDGHRWNTYSGHIVNDNSWCPTCPKSATIEAERRFREEVTRRGGTVLGVYNGIHTIIAMMCGSGHEFSTEPNSIMSMCSWCPVCNESHGERSVRLILNKYNIPFTPQMEHPNLPGRRYDFHFNHNNKEFYLEFDGEQHFTKVDFFCKTEAEFQDRRAADIMKTHTVITSGHTIIRLDYTLKDDEMERHILTAINDNNKKKLYLSNDSLYEWITNGVNVQPIPIILTLRIPPSAIIPPIHLTLNIMKSNVDTVPNVSIEQ